MRSEPLNDARFRFRSCAIEAISLLLGNIPKSNAKNQIKSARGRSLYHTVWPCCVLSMESQAPNNLKSLRFSSVHQNISPKGGSCQTQTEEGLCSDILNVPVQRRRSASSAATGCSPESFYRFYRRKQRGIQPIETKLESGIGNLPILTGI